LMTASAETATTRRRRTKHAMGELPPIRRWYKCICRVCDYYRLYVKLIVPRRLTHDEYHKAMQDALEHMVDCPRCGADPRQPCQTYAQWEKVWKT
jgi:hypothetical protein